MKRIVQDMLSAKLWKYDLKIEYNENLKFNIFLGEGWDKSLDPFMLLLPLNFLHVKLQHQSWLIL